MQPQFSEVNNKESSSPPPYGWNNTNGAQAPAQGSAPPMPAIPNPITFPNKNSNQTPYSNTNQGPSQNTNPNTRGAADAENGNWGNLSGLSSKKARLGFIRKVYLIVTSQLIFTFGICSIFVFVEPVKSFAKSPAGLALYILSYVIFVVLLIVFTCCPCITALRKVPYNYILLGALTLAMTYMLSMISAYHSIQAVYIAVGVTLVITIGVTIFAIQTKFDFTSSGCVLFICCISLAFIGFGFACLIVSLFTRIPVLQAVYGGLGALLMAIFLAFDTQMIMGGRKMQFSEEDYVNAALQLYLDICQMFLYLLQAFGSNK